MGATLYCYLNALQYAVEMLHVMYAGRIHIYRHYHY